MSERFLVKVHNDNMKEFITKLDDTKYVIPGRGFIEVPRTEAMKLIHGYSPIVKDGVGNDLNPRQLRLEFPKDAQGNEIRYKNVAASTKSMLDGKEYPSAEAMVAHILASTTKDVSEVKTIKGK